jgi:CRISPR-associated endonuclease Cas2
MSHWIVAYDVGDDGRRARLASALARHGVRRQLSVFECHLDEGAADALIASLRPLLTPGRDRLAAYAQCPACRAKRRELGPRSTVLEAAFYVV